MCVFFFILCVVVSPKPQTTGILHAQRDICTRIYLYIHSRDTTGKSCPESG